MIDMILPVASLADAGVTVSRYTALVVPITGHPVGPRSSARSIGEAAMAPSPVVAPTSTRHAVIHDHSGGGDGGAAGRPDLRRRSRAPAGRRRLRARDAVPAPATAPVPATPAVVARGRRDGRRLLHHPGRGARVRPAGARHAPGIDRPAVRPAPGRVAPGAAPHAPRGGRRGVQRGRRGRLPGGAAARGRRYGAAGTGRLAAPPGRRRGARGGAAPRGGPRARGTP